jgi:hypothetical protein
MAPREILEQTYLLGQSLVFPRLETTEVCHILLQDPKFFSMLVLIDRELADLCQSHGCPCGGALHKANYGRKSRGCPAEVRSDFEFRFSFCCSVCRKRRTAVSVRFLGRRVYLALAVVLMSARPAGPTSTQMQLSAMLGVPVRTLLRWKCWWRQTFPLTRLWHAECARFMPPVVTSVLPASLLERFTGPAAESLTRLLAFLSPLSVRQ